MIQSAALQGSSHPGLCIIIKWVGSGKQREGALSVIAFIPNIVNLGEFWGSLNGDQRPKDIFLDSILKLRTLHLNDAGNLCW